MATKPISFRVDTELVLPKLEARAKAAGVSVNDFCRQAALEKLGETEDDATRQEVENLREKVEQMRGEMAHSTRAILKIAGSNKLFTEQQASDWVKDTFGAEFAQPGGGSS